jgi:hypothetical protein
MKLQMPQAGMRLRKAAILQIAKSQEFRHII